MIKDFEKWAIKRLKQKLFCKFNGQRCYPIFSALDDLCIRGYEKRTGDKCFYEADNEVKDEKD